jgi:hypothetical protein
MSVASSSVSVTTSATVLHTADSDGVDVILYNSGSATVSVGPSGVSTSTGFPLAAGASLSMRLPPADVVYGIVATGSESVIVFSI